MDCWRISRSHRLRGARTFGTTFSFGPEKENVSSAFSFSRLQHRQSAGAIPLGCRCIATLSVCVLRPTSLCKSELRIQGQGKMRTYLIGTANWYDHPQYYDIAFQSYTAGEADFIEAACRKYCPFAVRRLLEPACGSGRLTACLAGRGHQMTGFDVNPSALSYLRRRLARQHLQAEIFEAEMSDFHIGRPVDAAYCTVGAFRYLLTEQAA